MGLNGQTRKERIQVLKDLMEKLVEKEKENKRQHKLTKEVLDEGERFHEQHYGR